MLKPISILIASTLALSRYSHSGSPQQSHHEHEIEQEQEKKQKYTCPMHPEVITDHPGNCPKCGMKLVPLKEKKRSTSNVEHSSPAVAGTSNHVQPETHPSHVSHPSDARAR